LRLGADYGYLGDLPSEQIPPFIAALGPWPARAVIVVALAAAAFAVVELPWRLSRSSNAAARAPRVSAI
jgi:uncharacterized membrane protein YwaF